MPRQKLERNQMNQPITNEELERILELNNELQWPCSSDLNEIQAWLLKRETFDRLLRHCGPSICTELLELRKAAKQMHEAIDDVYFQEFNSTGDHHGLKKALEAFDAITQPTALSEEGGK